MTFTLADADALAERAHEGQLDAAGKPYIGHPRAVAASLGDAPEYLRIAALLHDVVEDTDLTTDDLLQVGVPQDSVRIVDAVSRREDETYSAFIDRIIRSGRGAILVKLADVAHNLGRIEALPPDVQGRLRKRYTKALTKLVGALGSYSV